ncbi:hypothetical protein B0H15DRAFT_244516 [Mycena belliarum]|uniref:Secreted protein n=1 Tax=Mycena belliarum TaxID=1033014 RepID=A0AAD6U6I4_9AGAR|nr:hypothetical protein B0H15DRAFT_244516 [Mycena belliae]
MLRSNMLWIRFLRPVLVLSLSFPRCDRVHLTSSTWHVNPRTAKFRGSELLLPLISSRTEAVSRLSYTHPYGRQIPCILHSYRSTLGLI